MNFFVHETAVIDDNVIIGDDTCIWHFSHIMPGAKVGSGCIIGQNVMIATGVALGNHVKVQNNVSLFTGVTCEDYVFIGPSAVFTNVLNPRSAISRKDQFKKTLVKKGATIGANATILCGIEIGKYALVAAGAVVTKTVKNYALVMGNPARQNGWVSEFGHTLDFVEPIAVCPESSHHYKLENNEVIRID
jgi:UDP-2-acetamido-3-amino-2,3-dideoxy-glucuronate N-acetyltransferase